MKRFITLFVMVAAAGCATDEDTSQTGDTINGPVPGGIPTLCSNDADCPSVKPVPCWVNGECPEPADCTLLDEQTCLKRSDCVAVYNELSDAIIKPFLRCEPAPAPAPAPVCTPSGGTCNLASATAVEQCCPGLQCCGPALAEGGPDKCYAACPL